MLLQQDENLHPPVFRFIALRNPAADARIPYAIQGFALGNGAATRVGFFVKLDICFTPVWAVPFCPARRCEFADGMHSWDCRHRNTNIVFRLVNPVLDRTVFIFKATVFIKWDKYE